MAAAAAHAKDAKDAKELTLYISAHGLELGSSKPLKSSNKKYNTFLEKCLIVYEQGCSGLVNKGYTKISEFYEAFRDGKDIDTEDILKSLSVELRDEKCKEYGQSHRKMKMRRRNMETQFESIRDPDLNTFADKLFDKLKNYSDATGRGKIMIDKWSFSELVKKNKFEIFHKKLSEWTGLDKQTVDGLFSMAIEETEPAPKFAEDLFRCSLYSSYKLVNPVNDKKFFMSGKDESQEDKDYMNYGIYLIDIRGVDGGKDDEAINLLEKKHGYKFNLEQDNTICLSDILFECFNRGFDKVNIIDSSCRLFSSADDDDEDFLERLGRRTLDVSEIGWVTDFTTKILRANREESKKSKESKESKESKKSKKRKSMFRKKKSLKKSISCKKTLRLKR